MRLPQDDFNQRLREIDDLTRGSHPYLLSTDVVLYWREYTPGKGYKFSDVNQFISNLKKSPTRPSNELYWKDQDIGRAAGYFSRALSHDWLRIATLVPIPSSKHRDHPEYDDRMTRICRRIKTAVPSDRIDVRELVRVTESIEPAHVRKAAGRPRPTVAEIEAVYEINEDIAAPTPTVIGLFDDVLTNGTHFRAMSNVLTARYINVPIVGIFVARCVHPPIEAADFGFAP